MEKLFFHNCNSIQYKGTILQKYSTKPKNEKGERLSKIMDHEEVTSSNSNVIGLTLYSERVNYIKRH